MKNNLYFNLRPTDLKESHGYQGPKTDQSKRLVFTRTYLFPLSLLNQFFGQRQIAHTTVSFLEQHSD